MSSGVEIFLVDNGSLRPVATLALRVLAQKVSERSGHRVRPVSLLHSHKIEANKLGGEPATIVKRELRKLVRQGAKQFLILPLFLGPSRAITDYLPQVFDEVRASEDGADFEVVVADTLCGQSVEAPDIRLAEIVADQVRGILKQDPSAKTYEVGVVDHGTPAKVVNTLRNAVAKQVEALLAGEVASVTACSMERRDGPEYDFNEPLLERLGASDVACGQERRLIAAMFFLLPGRHAGAGGDVAEICDGLIESGRYCEVNMTPLIAEHPLLIEILQERLESALSAGVTSGV